MTQLHCWSQTSACLACGCESGLRDPVTQSAEVMEVVGCERRSCRESSERSTWISDSGQSVAIVIDLTLWSLPVISRIEDEFIVVPSKIGIPSQQVSDAVLLCKDG